MNCPQCSEPLIEGRVMVEGTILGFLLVGLSSQHLWFRRNGGKREKVISSGGSKPALMCERCGITVITQYRMKRLWNNEV